MKSRKKKIKNQKKSLKSTKELVWNKKTQGNKKILSSQKKYLTKNKSRVPMSSPSPSLNLMGKPMFGGGAIEKSTDQFADIYASISNDFEKTQAAEAKKAQVFASLKKELMDKLGKLGINWWDKYLTPQIDYNKIFDSVYYLSCLNVLDNINVIKKELGKKYTLLMNLKKMIMNNYAATLGTMANKLY